MLLKYMFLNRKTGIFDSKTPVSYCLPLETKEKGRILYEKENINDEYIVIKLFNYVVSMV